MTTPSVRWRGPLFSFSGYATEARVFLLELARRGVRVRADPLPWNPRSCPLSPATEHCIDEMTRSTVGASFVDVQHCFPDHWEPDGTATARVGRTMFETDRIPADWVGRCNEMDEVWVPSRFNLETFAASGVGEDRLVIVPSPVPVGTFAGDHATFEIPEVHGYTFLSVFDWSLRKGWDVLLRAYVEEFTADDDVTLVLRVHSSYGRTGAEVRELVTMTVRQLAARRRPPPVVVLDRVVPEADMPGLYRAADCLVAPSRGEGCGRPLLEAMASGLPVIATNWNGPAEFMDAEHSYPLEVEGVVPVPARALPEGPAFAGHRWAEPSLDHLRELMRHVYDHPDEARAKGRAAQAEVERRYDVGRACDAVVGRLRELVGSGTGANTG
ncbi:MAG: glycosyltransferase [Chloroflexota bacterium]|nr:glycosyltransferase [Chloroflexota bacterium]